MWIAAPLPIPGMAGPTWGAEHGLPDCESPPWRPAVLWNLAPLNHPSTGCASAPLNSICRSLHRPLSPSFPSRAHHLIFIKHAELMLHKSPQRGLT